MSFETRAGTRGGSKPSGPLFRLVNKVMAKRIRRGGDFRGHKALVLHTIGAKTGQERSNPVNWFPGPDGSWLIVASAAGAAGNPGWYYNIKAHPNKIRIEVDHRTIDVKADQLHGAEREQAWNDIATSSPQFAGYQEKTDRELPIIRLTPRD